MKKLLGFIVAMNLILPVYATDNKQPQTKKVCIDVKDKEGRIVKNKDGSNRQQCKEIRIHKKHEGTEIPKK